MVLRGIIFDLDGTLLDTLEDIGDAMNRTLVGQGFPAHQIDSYRFFVGDGFTKLISRALPEKERKDETIRRCVEVFRADYGQNFRRKTRPYPGIVDLIEVLFKGPLKLAVFSNKAHDITEKLVTQLLPRRAFHVIWGQRSGTPLKPDPAGALDIARNLGLTPSDFVYLGDSAVDMKTAVAAGMLPVGASWGFRPNEELHESGCKILLNEPMELLDLLR